MKNIKKFSGYLKEGVDRVRDLSELHSMEKWIYQTAHKLHDLDEVSYMNISKQIEDEFDETIFNIIDSEYSADKLHYNQRGTTVSTGGIDTGNFIENFDSISSRIDIIISENASEIDTIDINTEDTDTYGYTHESIKRFKEFSKINEASNIEELLANPENMWIIYVGDEPIGGMEYLHDAFHDVLLPRIADTEEEEYEFHDRVQDILSEIGSDYDEVDQDELNDKIDEMLNEMGKTPIYRIRKRSDA